MAGVRDVLGLDPLKVAVEHVTDPSEGRRRRIVRRRVDLFCGNSERVLREDAGRIFSRDRRQLYDGFFPLGAAVSLFRRVVDEHVRPVYSPPPLRTIYQPGGEGAGRRRARQPGADQPVWDAMVKESSYNQAMRLACGLAQGTTAAALHQRVNPRLGYLVDVIPAHAMSVIPDPDAPTRELAIIYDRPVVINGREVLTYVYWDDTEAFVFDQSMQVISIRDANDNPTLKLTKDNGHPGALPFVVVHREPRFGTYWNVMSGSELEHGSSAVGLIASMMLRVLKVQGHKQLGITDSSPVGSMGPGGIPQDQMLDPESPVIGTDGKSITVLHDPTQIDHFTKAVEMISTTVGANNGIGRDRMNSQGPGLADTAGLLERRADIIVTQAEVEQRSFELAKLVSRARKDRLKPEAAMACDFAEISTKVERSKLLEIWKIEIEMGLRNILDCVREDQPEIASEDDAKVEIQHNAEVRGQVVELLRALTIRTDATFDEPGQTAEDNGRMGSLVRDGKMSADMAKRMARGGMGSPEDRAVAMRLMERIRRAA